MNREFTIKAPKAYVRIEGARRAVARVGAEHLRHFIMKTEDGRYFPVFVGQEALQEGIHFHFNVVG